MKRTFIAIDIRINDSISGLLRRLKSELGEERIKWVEPAQYHITLQFLGNIDESYIKTVNDCLSKISGSINGFTLKLKGLGVFKNINNPRILWLGFLPCKELEILWHSVNNEMVKLGFDKPDKPFSPHLTIGRIKQLKDNKVLMQWIDKYRDIEFQDIEVGEVIFYESILRSQGPEYIPLKKHPLK